MDMKSLIHHQQQERAAAAAPSMAGLPGLRAQFPAMRLPLLRPPVDMAPPASSSASAASSAVPSAPSSSSSSSTSSSSSSAPSAATDVRRSPALAPLRFIIPSSSSAPSSVSFASSSAAALSYGHEMDAARTLFNTQSAGVDAYARDGAATRPSPPSSRPASPSSAYSIKTEDGQDLAGASAGTKLKQTPTAGGTKKAATKRSRQPKMTNRSTKSKARPGLRKGKWTDEESRYATQLTNYFKEGLLPIERGTMLRLYLSQKLNCEPMRITKKFTGGECIGKQVFRPCSPTPESRVRMMQAQLELVALEAAFIKRLKENREEAPAAIEELEANAASAALASAASDLGSVAAYDQARRFHRDASSDSDGRSFVASGGEEDVDDASAVGLLLDFFYKANRNDKEGDPKKAAASTPAPAPASPVKPEPAAEPEGADDKDALVNSPTKRIRALSISNFANDPAAAKRSRVGSFTVCA